MRERLEDVQIRFFRQQLEIAKKKAEAETDPKSIEIYNRLRDGDLERDRDLRLAHTNVIRANLGFKFELATRLQKAKKIDEAIALLQECRSDLKRKNQVHMALAKCFIEKKVYKLAMANYELAVEAAGSAGTEEKKFALYSPVRWRFT